MKLIHKEFLRHKFGSDFYKIIVDKFSFCGKDIENAVNLCTCCHFGGCVQTWEKNNDNTVTVYVKVYVD